MSINIVIEVPHDAEHYLESSARIRGISRTALMRRVLETVLEEKLVLSVLDDDDAPKKPVARKKLGRPANHDKPPRDRLYDALKRSTPVPQHRDMTDIKPFKRYKPQPTRSELQEQLRQAVLNTGGSLVE